MSKFSPFVAIGDNHGDLIDGPDCKAFLDFCADFKPKKRVHLGDNWDFRNIRKGVDPEEELDDPEPDLIAGYLFLERYKPTAFLCGNHDHRIFRMVNDTRGIVRKYARDGANQILSTLKAMQCQFFPYDIEGGIYRVGDWAFAHGYSAGINATREHASTYGNIVIGHLHRNEIAATRRSDKAIGICAAGIGRHKEMTYARHRLATLAWSPGFVFGVENERTGKATAWLATKTGTQWLLPTNLKQIG